jgi:hypothetical protein
MNDMDRSLRLMVRLAQPDSDSFDTSATAAGYAAEGVDITLVTARWRSAQPVRFSSTAACAARGCESGVGDGELA